MRGIKASFLILFSLAITAAIVLSAQESAAAPASGTKPAVSRLRASIEGASVLLSWVDCPDVTTSYVVYRSRQPFSPEVLPKAQRLASVGAGAGGYRDNPPPNLDWYYLVLALDESGLPSLVFTPMATMTKFPLKIGTAQAGETVSPSRAAPEPSSAGTKPADSEPASSSTSDSAPSGEGDLIAESLSTASLDGGKTSTAIPSQAGSMAAEPGPVSTDERPAPLPYFLYNSGIPTSNVQGDRLHGEAESISPATEEAAEKLTTQNGGTPPAQPQVRELAAQGGELADIVSGMAISGDRKDMEAALGKYIETSALPEDKARAEYYLGICLVKDGSLDAGIYELLKAREFFPIETKAWIDYTTMLLGGEY